MSTKLAAPTVLRKIFDRKKQEVAERLAVRPLGELQSAVAVADEPSIVDGIMLSRFHSTGRLA